MKTRRKARPIGEKEKGITQDALKSILRYDEETGLFTRIKSLGGKNRVGEIAGTVTPIGYIQIYAFGRYLTAHRLAWLYVYGEFPLSRVDHWDEDKANNRIKNLRLATNSENMQNVSVLRSDNRFGMTGVSINTRGKPFRSRIKVNGVEITLGSFDTAEQANAAYLSAKAIHHKFAIKPTGVVAGVAP